MRAIAAAIGWCSRASIDIARAGQRAKRKAEAGRGAALEIAEIAGEGGADVIADPAASAIDSVDGQHVAIIHRIFKDCRRSRRGCDRAGRSDR